jgi:hypothetical protein
MSVASVSVYANKTIYNFEVTRPVEKVSKDPTLCSVNQTELTRLLKLSEDVESSLKSGSTKFYAVNSNGGYYGTNTYTGGGYGHWFTASGIACRISSTSAKVYSTFSDGAFKIGHFADRLEEGEKISFSQAFVNGSDTVVYKFNVTMGSPEGYTTDQPKDMGRPDITANWNVIPFVQINDEPAIQQNYIQVKVGDKITLSATPKEEGGSANYAWFKTDTIGNGTIRLQNYKRYSEYVVTESAKKTDGGTYMLKVMKPGTPVCDCYFFVDVQDAPEGTPFDWSSHTPSLSYDFRSEYPNLQMPENILNAESNIAGRYSDRWWTFIYGPNKNSLVTEDAWKPMLERFNTDFEYMRNEMGWPPDKRARMGYKSTICMYGSGLSTDNASNTETGGWQGSTWYGGSSWPMVLISYYPIYCFDPKCPYSDKSYQTGAMIHEGIHCLLADYEGCKNSAWFQEAGNTWLQQEMEARRSGVYGTPGFLDPCPFVAPFMPIECYSGWLQDGSFGGPSAEGVNMFNGSQQICTWRNLLGGTQYANGFAVFLGANLGQGSVPWIWRYSKNRVLDGIADSIGDYQMRQVIMQYRAKQATMDLGNWSKGYRDGLNNNFGVQIKPEWEPYWINCKTWVATPYQTLTKHGETDWYAPDTTTCPGWSGGNQIPIHVEGDTVQVEFLPQGPGMMCQICYRTKEGTTYYSQPVNCGPVTLALKEAPANGVVFVVVANTDYIYANDNTRRKHHDYRIAFGKGVKGLASTDKRWYFYENSITDPDYTSVTTSVGDIIANSSNDDIIMGSEYGVQLTNGLIRPGDKLTVKLNGVDEKDVVVHIVGLGGLIADKGNLSNASFQLPSNIIPGMYVATFSYNGKQDVFKFYVKK